MRKEKAESMLLLFLLALPLFQVGSFLPAGATISFSVDSPIAPNTIANVNVTINEPKGKLAIKNVTTFLGNDLATLTYKGYERAGFLDDNFQDWVPYLVTVEKGDLTRVTIGSEGWGSLDYNLPDDKKFNGFIYRYIVLRISEWTSSNLRFSIREAGDDWKHWATWTGELDPSQDPIIIDIGEKLNGSMIVDGFSFYTDGSAGTGFVVDYVMAVSTTKEMEVAKGKTAFADSIQDADHDAAKAVDYNVGTRWASAPSSSKHWFAIDLGKEETVSLIRIYWEAAYTPTFLLQISSDGTNWITIYQFRVSGAGWQNYLIPPTTSRYWRIYDDLPEDNPFPNLSIWEVQLYANLENRWHYRKMHEIIGSSAGSQTDYQIRVEVHRGSGSDSGEVVYLDGYCREDFGDIRFYSDAEGNEPLSYWLEGVYSVSAIPEWIDFGQVEVGDDWVFVEFSKKMDNPIVYATYVEGDISAPQSPVIKDVTDYGFQIKLEVLASGATVVNATVYWIAVNSGVHTFNGYTIEAGTISTTKYVFEGSSNDWETITFAGSYSSTPIVLAIPQTFKNGLWFQGAVKEVSTTSAKVSLEAAGSGNVPSKAEVLGYIVVDNNVHTEFLYSYRTSDSVKGHDDGSYTVNLDSPAEGVVVCTQTRDGTDGLWMVIESFSGSSVSIHCEEDTIGDSERSHTTEVAGILAFRTPPDIDSYGVFWVRLPSIPAAPHTVSFYIFYGNPYATTTSNGEEVFPIFFDDMESGGGKWSATGLWHLTSKKYVSPTTSFWYGQEDTNNYATGSRTQGDLQSIEFEAGGRKLELDYWREVEPPQWSGYDKTIIYESSDGQTWNQIWYKDSGDASECCWTSLSLSISQDTKYIKFHFDSVDKVNNEYWGWFIDNVRIRKYVDPEPTHGTWGPPENLPIDEEPCQFIFASPSGRIIFDSASFTPLNSTAVQFSWKVKFTEACPRGYISLLAKYYNKDNEITECSEPSFLYLLGPSYGVSEVESESKVPHVAVVLWYQGWPVVDIRLVARMLNDTGIDMSHVSVAVDMGRLYPGSGAYDPDYAGNVTWLQENFPEMTVYGCNLPTRLSNNPYQEAVDQLDWFYSVFGYYPKFINQFGLGKETYQALEEKGVKIVFSKCFEESSFNASDYRRYRGNEEYGTAATCDEGGLWQPYKPSRRNENIPGANISDQFDLWECGFLSRDLPHAYFDEPFYSNHPADVLALTNYDVEEAKEYLTRLLDMYELNAKWNDVTVMHLSISSTMFFDPDDQNAEARRYLLHWEIAEMLRRGFIFVNAEELADLLDQFETTPTYKWVSSGTFTRMRGGGYLAEGTWKYGTFVAVGNGSGRAIFSVATDYDSVMGSHWIEVCNYTRLSRYSTKWSSIRAPIGTNPYFYTNGTPTGYPDDQFIPFYRASDGYFYYPNTQLYVLNTSVVVKNDAIYIEVWSTPPPDAPQCYFVEKITVIPSAIIYRVEAIKEENVGTSDIQVCLRGIANPNDNSPDPQVDSKIHIVDSSGDTYTASDTNPNIIIESKPHKMGDAVFFYAYQNGEKIGAGIYLLTDCDGVYVADQPGSKGAVTYQLEGLKVPSNSKKTAPLEIVIVAASSLDSVISLGQKIAQAYSGFYRGGRVVNCTRYTNGKVTALINDVVYDSQYNNPKSLQVTVDLRELDISTDGEFTIVENYKNVIDVDVSPVDEKITFTAQVSSLGLSTYLLRPHFNRPYIASHGMQFLSEVSATSNWLNATLHASEIPYSNIAHYYTSFSTGDWYAFHVTLKPDDFSEITLDAPYTDGSLDQNNIPFDSSEFPYLIFKVSSASVSHYRWSVYNGTDWYHWFWYSNLTGEHVIDLHGYGQIQKISLHIWGEPGDTIVLDYLKIVDCYPHFAAEVSIVSSRGAATYLLNVPYAFKGKLDVDSYLVGTYAIPMRTTGTIEFQANFAPWLGNLAVYAVTDRLTKASQVDNKKIFDFWISDSTGSGEITFYCGLLGEPKQYHNLTDLQYNEITKQATGKYVLASTLKVTLSWEEIPAPILVAPEANQRFDPELEVQFAWTFTNQTAYQFQLGTDPEFTTILIDTGKVDSTEQNILQQLPQTVQLYYWRVKCWDQYSFESPWSESRTVIVDRVKIIGGGVVNLTIDVDVGGKIWYYAVYEYDNSTFDDSCGVLYLNGFEMTWNGEKWVYAFPYSTEGNQMIFHITGMLDSQYGLTTINNQVGDIIINWATATVEIKR